jgi:aspartate aminotransferase
MDETYISKRIESIQPSMTTALHARLIQMQSQGQNILNLGIGEPDLNSPEAVKTAAIEAIRQNQTRYTNNRGSLELRESIAGYIADNYGLTYDENEIIASNGAKQALFLALNAALNPGEKVLIFRPFYPSYLQMPKLSAAKIIVADLQEENDFQIEIDDLQKIDFTGLKVIILNIPANPTGAGISANASAYLAKQIIANELILICDDIYRDIYFSENAPIHPLLLEPRLKDYTILINGVSKSSAMTGWRLGYAAGNATLIAAMDRLQNQVSGHPSSISQAAAIAALRMQPHYSQNLRTHYARRRELFFSHLNQSDFLNAVASQATFYQYLNIKWFIEERIAENSLAFAQKLLEDHKIFVMPAEAFGHSSYIRITLNMEADEMEYFFKTMDEISGRKSE